jgi:hypothetical protein
MLLRSHRKKRKGAINVFQEGQMNADVLTTRVTDGIAVITLGSTKRIYFDQEMGGLSWSKEIES